MKVDIVKQFCRENISRYEKRGNTRPAKVFDLYDKNNNYCGEYFFKSLSSSDYLGVARSISTIRIMDEKLNQKMQEVVYMNKDYVNLVDPSKDICARALPSEITTTTTVLDYVNDKFKTVRFVSKLINKLERIGKDNPYFKYSDNFIIYEPLKEKPQYEKSIEFVREGSISETKKNPIIYNGDIYLPKGGINQIPYRYW
jgi:hypothetical protein